MNPRTASRSMLGVGAASAALAVAAAVVLAGASSAARAAGTPPANAGLPTISGTAREGNTLTASSGVWGGTVPITYTYQWQVCGTSGSGCSPIGGATRTTLVLTSAQVGHTIRVQVNASNSEGSTQAFSQPTATVASKGTAPANTKQPDPSGVAQEGVTITVTTGSWSGAQPISYTYAWQRCKPNTSQCSFISGATSHSYAIVAADVGLRLRAQVTAKNSIGAGSTFSNLTDTVVAKENPPTNTQLPVIVGETTVGKTVTAYPGTWSGAKSYSYAWLRCNAGGGGCSAIPGANGTQYVLSSADEHLTVRAQVTASNSAGSTKANSVALAVGTAPPSGSAVPVTSLTARPDHLLIKDVKFSPSPFKSPGGTLTVRVKVVQEGTNKPVSGALVYITPAASVWAKASAELPTGNDGWISLSIKTTKSLPHSGGLVMQVRARGPGNSEEAILGGISTRRLVQVSLG